MWCRDLGQGLVKLVNQWWAAAIQTFSASERQQGKRTTRSFLVQYQSVPPDSSAAPFRIIRSSTHLLIRVQATMGPNPIQTPYPNKGQHLASHRSSPSQLDSVKIDSCSHARALAQETLMALCKSSDMLWPWPILSIAEAEHEEADSAGIVDEYARGGHVPSLGEFIATKHPRYHHAFNVFRALRSVPNPSVGTLSQCSLTVYMVGKENPMATKSKLRKCCRAMCYMR